MSAPIFSAYQQDDHSHFAISDDAGQLLFVDDEKDTLQEMVSYFDLHGFVCHTAENGLEALRKLQEVPAISTVIADIRMPEMDGLALAHRLNEASSPAMPREVILVTGHAGTAEAASAMQAGVFDFVQKPASLKDLLARVQRAERRTQLKRQDYFNTHFPTATESPAMSFAGSSEKATHDSAFADTEHATPLPLNVENELVPAVKTLTVMANLLDETLFPKDCRSPIVSDIARDTIAMFFDHLMKSVSDISLCSEMLAFFAKPSFDSHDNTVPGFVDCLAVLYDTVDGVRQSHRGGGVRLAIKSCGAVPAVQAQRESLQQVLTHLIHALAQMGPVGGTLDISVEASIDGVVFSFASEDGFLSGGGREAVPPTAIAGLSFEFAQQWFRHMQGDVFWVAFDPKTDGQACLQATLPRHTPPRKLALN